MHETAFDTITRTLCAEGVEWTGSGAIDNEFISVTNRILMNGKSEQLIRLRVDGKS